MKDDIHPRAHRFIGSIEPYKLGMSTGELANRLGMAPEQIIRLAANENPYGMSEKVRQAIQANTGSAARYPEVAVMQRTIAERFGLQPDNVIPGNGSCEVLELVATAFLNPKRTSIYPLHSFVMYKLATQYAGAIGIAIPPGRDYADNLPAMLAAIGPDTGVIWVSNVNNPAGGFTPYDKMKQFIQHVPPSVIVVLDEAYYEYLPETDQTDSLSWIHEFPNLVITRTFSKAHGMAGLRAGYGIAATKLANAINNVRGPYNCNALSIIAVQSALQDQGYTHQSRQQNTTGRQQLQDGLDKLGIKHLPSWGNFVTIETADAMTTYDHLLGRGIVVLPLNGYTMPRHIRVSVGLPEENKQLLHALASQK